MKGQLWSDSTDVRCLEQASSHTEKEDRGCQGLKERDEVVFTRDRVSVWEVENS